MSRFNPDFWETTIDAASWEAFAVEDGLWHRGADGGLMGAVGRRAGSLWPQVSAVMAEALTERQREVVELYYLQEQNQRQIAEHLGISQQAVSEHLYGKRRNGRTLGGALPKLQKACSERGIRW